MCKSPFYEGVDDAAAVSVRAFTGGVEAKSEVGGLDVYFGCEVAGSAVNKDVEEGKLAVTFHFMSKIEGGVVLENVDEFEDLFFVLGADENIVHVAGVDFWLELRVG